MSRNPARPSITALAGDLLDGERYTAGCPHAALAEVRERCPVGWLDSDRNAAGGVWAVTRQAEVAAVSKDPDSFSSAEQGIFIDPDQVFPLDLTRQVLLYKDPPEHTQYRKILQSAFTPNAVASMEPRIRARTTRLIDAVVESGSCDFVEALAVPLPLGVLAEILVIPEEDVPQLYEWTELIEQGQRADVPNAAMPVFEQMAPYLLEHVQRQLELGGENVITRLAKAEIDGRPIAETEIIVFLTLLIFAGNDTTRNTASSGLLALLENPDQWGILCEDPTAIGDGVEEILRYTSVVRWFTRTAKRDVEVGGQRVAAGEKVLMHYASASRDERVYERPERLDVTRAEHDHSAFGGGGRHFCLGAGLARLELRILLEELTRRLPDVRLAGDPEWLPSSWAGGLTSLPIEFTPGAREAEARG